MDCWQQEIKRRLEAFHPGRYDRGFAISIKVRVTSGCFCRGCCPVACRMIEEYRDSHREGREHWEYVEHESGPELLLYLGLVVAGLGIAEKSLGIIKSAIDLVALIVKARAEGRKKGDKRPEPLVIVVRGFDASGVFFEKPVIEVDMDQPPTSEVIEDSLSDVIHQIAEERVRRERCGDD